MSLTLFAEDKQDFTKNDLPKNRSLLWKFFDLSEDDKATCKICSGKIKGNVLRHLRSSHPKSYEFWKKNIKKQNSISYLTYQVQHRFDGRKHPEWQKQFARKVGNRLYNCSLCEKKLKLPDLKKHIIDIHPEIYYNDIYSEPEINTEKNCGSIECNDSLLAVNNLPTANENVLQVGNNIINEDIRLDNDITLNNMDVYDIDFENNNFENLKIDIDYGLTEDVSKVTETFIGNFANDDFKAILETTNEVSCNDSGDDPTKTNSEVYKTSKDLILDSSETTEKSNPCITKETVEKIKMLCTKVDVNRKKPNRKTCIWNFFDVTLDTRIYKCSFCFIEISIAPKCVSNLKRHLILQHSLEYDLIMKYAPFNDPCKVMTPLLYAFAETDPNIIRNFEIFDEGCYKCKLCGQVIVCATNRPLLIGHLREKHPLQMIDFYSN